MMQHTQLTNIPAPLPNTVFPRADVAQWLASEPNRIAQVG